MSGYTYGSPEPRRECPYCDAECHADFADVGVGFVQVGPYHCGCGANKIGPYDPPRELTKQEEDYGWYAPGTPVTATSGNVLDGKIVGHEKARKAYRESCGVFDKPKLRGMPLQKAGDLGKVFRGEPFTLDSEIVDRDGWH